MLEICKKICLYSIIITHEASVFDILACPKNEKQILQDILCQQVWGIVPLYKLMSTKEWTNQFDLVVQMDPCKLFSLLIVFYSLMLMCHIII